MLGGDKVDLGFLNGEWRGVNYIFKVVKILKDKKII